MANSENLHGKLFDSERGREMQKRSAASRVKNREVREVVREVLSTPVTDSKQLAAIKKAGLPVGDNPLYMDFVVAAILLRCAQKGRMSDLLTLMQILGEDIGSENDEALEKASELLNGVDSVIE